MCEHDLNEVLNYTVVGFELNEGAKAFHKWFETSIYVGEFEFNVTKDHENTEVLEVVQYNPNLSVQALHTIYALETNEDEDPFIRAVPNVN